MDFYYDIETFPNCFQMVICGDDNQPVTYEISSRKNEIVRLSALLRGIARHGDRMIGFNNLGFDYPVLHFIFQGQISDPKAIYDFAMAIINAPERDRFRFMVWPSDRIVQQIDLYKIHHFDNKARMTSLKALEFNMRMDDLEDLPFPVGTYLTEKQMDRLAEYCEHDVMATKLFAGHSREKIAFREQLALQYPTKDWLNYSDVKIGKEFFQIRLEQAGVECYTYGPEGRRPKQTPRPVIYLGDCVPWFVYLQTPEFNRILGHFLDTTVMETKGAFKDLTAKVNGLTFVFGTGGIHASVEQKTYVADDEWMIYDIDVTSLYPSIAIENGYYPEHLGPVFVATYRQLREERMKHKKGSAENAMLKLALNGVYGVSNDPFSVFYDPLFTMKITIGGQLMIAMLAEWLMWSDAEIIQANTDGITMRIRRSSKPGIDRALELWEHNTRLSLEKVEYSKMVIADVNNYIAVKTDGTVKRKGRYDYECEWHQNASALVVPKVAEKVLLEGAPILKTLEEWPDMFDFMKRIKANKGTNLVTVDARGEQHPLGAQTQRYYITPSGVAMFKDMPPLKGKDQRRLIAVEAGREVCLCNHAANATMPIDYEYYAGEVEKLVLGVL